MPLISVNDVKAFRAVPDTADESWLTTYGLDLLDEWWEGELGRPYATAAHTERINGTGTRQLRLACYPVTAVTSVVVDGVTWSVLTSADALDTGQQCFLPPAQGRKWPCHLEARDPYVWPAGQGNIRVVYTAGNLATYADVKTILCMVAHLMLKEKVRIGEGTMITGPEQINLMVRNADQYQVIRDTIARYRVAF